MTTAYVALTLTIPQQAFSWVVRVSRSRKQKVHDYPCHHLRGGWKQAKLLNQTRPGSYDKYE